MVAGFCFSQCSKPSNNYVVAAFAKGVTDGGKSHVNFGDLPSGGYIGRVIGEGRVRLKDGACLVTHSEVRRRTGGDKRMGHSRPRRF